jgi:hypothetical protein
MTRVRTVAALTAVLALALTAVALAAFTKVTGGTTSITASAAAAKVLADNNIKVTPLAPATASGATFTFPISGGRVNTKNLHGVVRHRGGIAISNGSRSVKLRRPTIVSTARGASLFALARTVRRTCHRLGRHHLHRVRCLALVVRWRAVRVASITGVTLSGGKASGTVEITALTAHIVNRLAGKHVVKAGAVLGTATVAPTLKP